MNIHHVAIQTNDIDKAIHFYNKILGAKVIKNKEPFKKRYIAWLQVNNIKIEIFSKKKGENLNKWNNLNTGTIHMAIIKYLLL